MARADPPRQVPTWARSVQILRGDQPLLTQPTPEAKRRGSATREAHLPLFGMRSGPGCQGAWLHVGPQAWVCQDAVRLSGEPAIAAGLARLPQQPDGLPFRYFFAGPQGSLGYERIEQVDVGEPVATLEPGFAVAVVEQRQVAGQRYGRTNRGQWLPLRDFNPARPFDFHGAVLSPEVTGSIPVAWVIARRAPLYRRQGQRFVITGQSRKRFDRVAYLAEAETFGRGYARIDDDHWIRRLHVRHPTLAAAPAGLRSDAHWIDIHLASQTLVAFEGHKPVFATLISSGKGKPKGHPFETPKGLHRVWVKLLSSVMDNLEDPGARRYYRIEDVPYVQYFAKGVGLHAAFWHRSFGQVRSHGCVNLAPRDAQWLFGWTGPRLPAGWTAVLPSQHDRGSVIRVR